MIIKYEEWSPSGLRDIDFDTEKLLFEINNCSSDVFELRITVQRLKAILEVLHDLDLSAYNERG